MGPWAGDERIAVASLAAAAGGDRRWPGRLAALARKYRILAQLAAAREAREARGEGRFPAAEASLRRAAMRRVARRFPGALRELDRLPAATLAARAVLALATAERLRRDPRAPIPTELALVAIFHRELRRALRRKRWLLARLAPAARPGDPRRGAAGLGSSANAFGAARVARPAGAGSPGQATSPATATDSRAASLPPDVLGAFARRFRIPSGEAARAAGASLRPPSGRLAAAVLEEVARRLGLSPEAGARLCFDPGDHRGSVPLPPEAGARPCFDPGDLQGSER